MMRNKNELTATIMFRDHISPPANQIKPLNFVRIRRPSVLSPDHAPVSPNGAPSEPGAHDAQRSVPRVACSRESQAISWAGQYAKINILTGKPDFKGFVCERRPVGRQMSDIKG
jgi:hypothetical protein